MTTAGTSAVKAADTLINLLSKQAPDPKFVTIYYCEATASGEFPWLRIVLSNEPPLPPSPSPDPSFRIGVEVVQSMVSSLLQAKIRLTRSQHHCLFCQKAIVLDDEYFVYLYRPVSVAGSTNHFAHIMIMAYFCPSTACIIKKAKWLKALRDSDTPESKRHCSQCGAESGPAGSRFLSCGNCKMVNYCSVECQQEHRGMHKHFCRTFCKKIEPKE